MARPRLLDGFPLFSADRITYEAAARAAISLLAPLLVLLALDRIDLGIYASFAAFTALYGRAEPYRHRWLSVLAAAAGMVAAIVGGMLVQAAGAPLPLFLAGHLAVIAVTTPLSHAMQWIPAGSLFFSFSYLVCAIRPLPDGGSARGLADGILVALAVAAFSWAVAMSGWLLRRIPALRGWMRELPRVPVRGWRAGVAPEVRRTALVAAIGSLAAGWISEVLQIAGHQYWAMVTVVAIFSTPAMTVSFERLIHRVAGTLAGVGMAAAMFGGAPPVLYVVLMITLCSFITEATVGAHYGFALTFITPLAIGAANLGLTSEWELLFVDRARETLIGGAIALGLILAVRWWLSRGAADPAPRG
ncbi:MAG: FUSC family protein [Microbacteriaceae bacterium]|nr:FUSC family protein [Microbacteriaceae bacterium]